MKTSVISVAALSFAMSLGAGAQEYTNFIRQVQVNSGAEWSVPVEQIGEQLSPLAIDPGGARFELWTVRQSDLADYLIDDKYVGTYVPQVTITIESEDPYVTRPRTRADRPFTINMKLAGMSTDPAAPQAARMARIQHHAQSYGEDGDGIGIDPSQASMLSDGYIDTNGDLEFKYTVNNVPSDSRSKARGEERFSALSIPDYQAPESQLASRSIQIWPVADGAISGLVPDQQLRFDVPTLTVTLNDLYPDSKTYAHVYKGSESLGSLGKMVPGSAVVIQNSIPQDRTYDLDEWASVIDESGEWTMEILTETPFGIDRLYHVSFVVDRDILFNGTVTTSEKN